MAAPAIHSLGATSASSDAVRYLIVHVADTEPRPASPDHPGPAAIAGPRAAVHSDFVRLSRTEGVSAANPALHRQSKLRHSAENGRGRHSGAAGARLHGVDQLGAGKS